MEAVFEIACGLDVHKESVVACVRAAHDKGKRATRQVKTFEAHLRGLKQRMGSSGPASSRRPGNESCATWCACARCGSPTRLATATAS
jgi:hypothetical protein